MWCDTAHCCPFCTATGVANLSRMRAVMIPLSFFTLAGSTYTELPVDVLPISLHRDCAVSAGTMISTVTSGAWNGSSRIQSRMHKNVSLRPRLTNRQYDESPFEILTCRMV